MSSLFAIHTTPAGIHTAQYLGVLALVLAMLVAGLTALVRCEKHWLHEWLHLGWFGELLLSSDPRQQTLCLRYLVGGANCIAGIAALNYGVALGVVDAADCRLLTVIGGITCLALYLVLRTGLNKRLSDPTMSQAQVYCAVFFLAWGYAIGGPAKPVALMLLFVILMFSMFTSGSKPLIRACVLSALLFGLVMWRTAWQEQGLPEGQQVQLVYFCVMVITLVSLCVMVSQLSRLRAKSTRRKQELTEALERIRELATRDDLTGLFNRRHMLDLLNTEKQRSQRSGRSFCVGLIDVDHFKAVNDTHGHGVGDEVLGQVARAISAGLRETDVVARWGGEEFLVMFTDTDCSAADAVLARIQARLATMAACPGVPELKVTFSAGLSCHASEEPIARTIDHADRALYMAKAAGRNRIVRA